MVRGQVMAILLVFGDFSRALLLTSHLWIARSPTTETHMNQDSEKLKGPAIVLALFLGGFGGHKFYLGQTGMGVLYLVFFWTLIPACAAVIELILLAIMPEQTFHQRFNGASSEPMRACPFCAEQIKVAATTCRFCHKDMPG